LSSGDVDKNIRAVGEPPLLQGAPVAGTPFFVGTANDSTPSEERWRASNSEHSVRCSILLHMVPDVGIVIVLEVENENEKQK
jgi:hypothetical protein